MILRTEVVQQTIDADKRALFVKDVCMTSGQPIGMVRKRNKEVVEGKRPSRGAVLLIHGFGQNRYTWHVPSRSFSAYLAEDGWDVFNTDLRGHGRSLNFDGKRPQVLDDYILEDMPRIAQEVLELSGAEKLVLIGHSMGGLISYCAGATKLRGKVQAIGTIGSPYRFGAGSAFLRGLATVLQASHLTGVLDSNPHLPMRFMGRHLRRRRELWDSRLWRFPVRPWRPGAVEAEILDEYLSLAFEQTNLQIALDILAGGDRVALHSRDGAVDYGIAFETLNVPLMVVAGDEDGLAPPKSVRAAYERSGSQDKSYRVFPLGHIDLIMGREAVASVWPLFRDWLRRHERPGAGIDDAAPAPS